MMGLTVGYFFGHERRNRYRNGATEGINLPCEYWFPLPRRLLDSSRETTNAAIPHLHLNFRTTRPGYDAK